MPFWAHLNFQNFAMKTSSLLETLHDFILVWLTVILILVLFFSLTIFFNPWKSFLSMESESLETVWTVIPIIILLSLAIPSVILLNIQDVWPEKNLFSMKLTSSQWSWQSETMETTSDHLLDADSVIFLSSLESPMVTLKSENIRLILNSSDVLHSLGLPSLGVKLDSIPGRLNMVVLSKVALGWYIGSCYELCGTGHSAMPISLLNL